MPAPSEPDHDLSGARPPREAARKPTDRDDGLAEPDEAVGEFGDREQSDPGGDSDVDVASEE